MNRLQNLLHIKNILLNKPSQVYMHYSDKCNLRCLQCSIWKPNSLPHLSYKNKIILLKKLKKSLGFFNLSLNGGEPFSNETIFKFLKFCEKESIPITLVTNATLIDDLVAKRISKLTNLKIVISLDGAKETTHDYLRGVKGTYQKVMQAIDNLHENNFFRISIHTVVSSKNLDELVNLVYLCDDKKIKEISFQPIALAKGDMVMKHNLWPKNIKNVKKHINNLLVVKKDSEKGNIISNSYQEIERLIGYFNNPCNEKERCNTSLNVIRINRYGELYLCNGRRTPYGNLLENDFEDVYNEKVKNELRKKISKCNYPCKFMTCNRKRNFSFYLNKAKTLLTK